MGWRLIVFKHLVPAGRNPPDPDVCRMSNIRHFRTSGPDSGTPLMMGKEGQNNWKYDTMEAKEQDKKGSKLKAFL